MLFINYQLQGLREHIYINIGKTKRNLEIRVKEHFTNKKMEIILKSAVAAHVWEEKHVMDRKPVLIKQASNKQEWTNWENILITKNKDHIINFEIPPANHLTGSSC